MSNFYLQQSYGIETVLGFSTFETEKYKNVTINPVVPEYFKGKNKQSVLPFQPVKPKNDYPVLLMQDVINDDQTASFVTIGYIVLTVICFLLVNASSC